MHAPHLQKPDVEKIRKAQWTVENTRRTQSVVNDLKEASSALGLLTSGHSFLKTTLERAVQRFHDLDVGVSVD